jgi:hypothetical protein
MSLRYIAVDFHHAHRGHKGLGPEAHAPSWPPTESQQHSSIDTGDNSAGNGGNGYFSGNIIDHSHAVFEPFNTAEAAANATAGAHQANVAYFDQSASQIAGIGGNGGNENAAIGGGVNGFGSSGSDAITTGGNSAGNGGDGYFSGALVDAPVAVFDPVNIAVAGIHSTADAHQSNAVQFQQSAFQFAGGGGNGGNGNAAIGGSAADAGPHMLHVMAGSNQTSHQGLIGSDATQSGDNQAGNGGDGYFYGSLVHTSVALYDPINVAVAGYDSTSQASQSNNVNFDQSSVQMAGIGGNGGSGNVAIGGDAAGPSSILGLIGSDVIATGGNSAGIGGNGHFAGSLVDLNIAIYAPINIAVAGPNSTADAEQTNNVAFDQGAIQIAGVGGDGGLGNAALGGDVAMHLLSDLHLLGHA